MTKKTFFKNALAGLLAAIISSMVMLRIGHRFVIEFVPYTVQCGIVGLYFLAVIIYLLIWKRKTAIPEFDSQRVLAFWQGIIRYFIALDLCTFALQKFFHLQFALPLGVLDNPFSSLSGEEMIWAFFGHFYAFTVIIGGMQIIGSLMLLFRKTRLLGVIVLLPILLNILLLDWFYDLGIVVNLYITILCLAMVYLLLIEYDRLVEFFFIARSNLPQFEFKNAIGKNLLRASVIFIPLLLLAVYKFPPYYPEINGKYEVKNMLINGKRQNVNTCRDSVLTKIFIDHYDLVFEFDNYQRRFIGNYKYDKATGSIIAVWHYPFNMHDTLFAKILPGKTAGSKILSGRMGIKEFRVDLLQVK
ncbi:MAG: hypothetical protein M3O71_00030 [Bacteroidota bacterium]|nr:hypothetical protein [Bacteroidota bacterium]